MNKSFPHSVEPWQHRHNFLGDHRHKEKRTLYVIALTVVTMVVEIGAGVLFGSMALLADGWHMATHAAAFGITLYAYRFARRHADDPRFTFGTGKVSVLGGFASSIALAAVALFMLIESVERFFSPAEIHFNEAITVAVVGLVVNIVSAFMLHSHAVGEHLEEHDHDHNIKGAYFHVLADAITSVTAILALTLGKFFGWVWMDPAMGIVGAFIILHWADGLTKETSVILLDGCAGKELRAAIGECLNSAEDQICDLHIWCLAPGHYGAIISLASHAPKGPLFYKQKLASMKQLTHITVEVIVCCPEKVQNPQPG